MSVRMNFFLSHLSISCLITLTVLGLVFYGWYPAPLATAVGVTVVFLMMLAIDVIIGPILGLLVYKEGKKSLKFDLSVIFGLQLTALCYGIYSIEQGRPVWIAYNVDRFELVRKNEMITDHIEQALPQFQDTPWLKPQYVAVQFAIDAKTRNDDLFAEVLGNISLAQKPERYVDFINAVPQIKQQAKNVKELEQYNDIKQAKNILDKYPEATGYLPLKANAVDMTVLVNKEGEVIKIVDLRPWL